MSEQKQQAKVNLMVVVTITLAVWLILVPMVNQIHIPIAKNTTGVISLASIENISPYTDYLKYLILLLIPPLVAAIFLNLNRKQIEPLFNQLLLILNHHYTWIGISSLLLLSWLINIPFDQFEINSTLIDSFHEGEFLGFIPNFLQLKQPFINTILIHGYGIDVLPSWLAKNLATQNNGIALTRLFVNLQNVVACLGYFWILWELIQITLNSTPQSQEEGNPNLNVLKIFLLSCLAFCILDGIFFKFDGRRGAWFILQFALTLRFFRLTSPLIHQQNPSLRFNQAQWLSALVGASIPFSFLYVYDRGIYFIAIYLLTSILTLFVSQKIAKFWLMGSLFGIAIASLLITLLLGFDQVQAIFSQILYWGKYGRYISFIPLPPLELTWTSQVFWLSMFIQSAVLVYLLLEFKIYHLEIRPFLQNNNVTILLLAAASVYMRITLDRSDLGHAYHGALMTAFLGFYLICQGYKNQIKPSLSQVKIYPFQQLFIVLLIIVFIVAEPNFNVFKGIQKFSQLPNSLSQSDQTLLKPDYLKAWQQLQPEIDQQSCFFSLTSEGLWYYLFNKPSCSKYGYVLYAKPTIAQQQVIQELNQTKPDIILLTNEIWYQNPWDQVLKSESASLIYQDVLTHYKPYKTVESHWFWKRSDQAFKFTETNLINGYVESIPTEAIHPSESLTLTGWSIIPKTNQPADAVYLSEGENNRLIAVGQVNINRPDVVQFLSNLKAKKSGWVIQVPTAILSPETHLMKVWSYDAKANQLIQIGEPFNLKIRS